MAVEQVICIRCDMCGVMAPPSVDGTTGAKWSARQHGWIVRYTTGFRVKEQDICPACIHPKAALPPAPKPAPQNVYIHEGSRRIEQKMK